MIYHLKIDSERISDPAYDALIIPTNDSNKYRYYFSNPNLYGIENLPALIFFKANFNYVPIYDIPFTDSGLFVVSEKVKKIISEIDQSDWFVSVPVVMIDDEYSGETFKKDGELLDSVPTNSEYSALRFSNLLNCFDRENSIFRPLRSDPNLPGRINKIVLTEPKNGFPPMFRVDVVSSSIFVREEIKIALEQNGVTGCKFDEIETTQYE